MRIPTCANNEMRSGMWSTAWRSSGSSSPGWGWMDRNIHLEGLGSSGGIEIVSSTDGGASEPRVVNMRIRLGLSNNILRAACTSWRSSMWSHKCSKPSITINSLVFLGTRDFSEDKPVVELVPEPDRGGVDEIMAAIVDRSRSRDGMIEHDIHLRRSPKKATISSLWTTPVATEDFPTPGDPSKAMERCGPWMRRCVTSWMFLSLPKSCLFGGRVLWNQVETENANNRCQNSQIIRRWSNGQSLGAIFLNCFVNIFTRVADLRQCGLPQTKGYAIPIDLSRNQKKHRSKKSLP